MASKFKNIDPKDPLEEVSFVCLPCDLKFSTFPSKVVDSPHRKVHPYDYFRDCPKCHQECKQQPWEIGMMQSIGTQKGPTTDAGMKASIAALEKAKTPENIKRMRFNRLKHGMYSKTLEFFPARPGQYLKCKNCTITHDVCSSNTVCAKEADSAMRYQQAFAENDPTQLRDIQANVQAQMQSIMDNIMLSIINTGVEVRAPEWYVHPEKGLQIVEFKGKDGTMEPVVKIQAHPLLKNLTDFISKNNQSLADMGMTPKLHIGEEELQGKLSGAEQKGDELLDYQRRQTDALEGLKAMIENSKKQSSTDPILLEHGGHNG